MTTNTQAELREKFSKQHKKWLIGTCDDAEAAQEWVMENLPSLLALLPPAPAVGEALEALEWYASIYAWKGEYLGRDRHGLSEYDTSPASRDLGERARKALAALGEGGA